MLGRSNLAYATPPWREDLWPVGSPKLLTTSACVQVRSRIALQPAHAATGEPCLSLTAGLSLGWPHALVMFRPGSEEGEPDVTRLPSVFDSALVTDVPRLMPEHLLARPNGGDPYVWIMIRNSAGSPLSNPICLGRSREGALGAEPSFDLGAHLTLWLSLSALDLHGPRLRLSGGLRLADGAALEVILGDECDRFGNPAPDAAGLVCPLVRAGATVEIPEQRVGPGDPRNLWVSLILRGAWGGAIGEEITMGRCTRRG